MSCSIRAMTGGLGLAQAGFQLRGSQGRHGQGQGRLGKTLWGRAPPPTRPILATTCTWARGPKVRRRLRARGLACRSSP